jgi:transcriptional regulator with XRE-family HTH domain
MTPAQETQALLDQGLTQAEIARRLGISRQAVYSRLHPEKRTSVYNPAAHRAWYLADLEGNRERAKLRMRALRKRWAAEREAA